MFDAKSGAITITSELILRPSTRLFELRRQLPSAKVDYTQRGWVWLRQIATAWNGRDFLMDVGFQDDCVAQVVIMMTMNSDEFSWDELALDGEEERYFGHRAWLLATTGKESGSYAWGWYRSLYSHRTRSAHVTYVLHRAPTQCQP